MNISPVFPIPVSFNQSGLFDYSQVKTYIEYLKKNKVKNIMTTCGTSQFNLLTEREIFNLNLCCAKEFDGYFIAGMPVFHLSRLKNCIEKFNFEFSGRKNIAILIKFPERYYYDLQVIDFFVEVSKVSKFPVFIHADILRECTGGFTDFSDLMLNDIINKTDNILGMKEECSTLENGYELCRETKNKNFKIIVAGGSQRRWSFLKNVGADTFLAGMGSFFPKLDIDQQHMEKIGCFSKGILKREDRFFQVMMKYGWHRCMRSALRQMHLCCFYDREPFPRQNNYVDQVVWGAIKELEAVI